VSGNGLLRAELGLTRGFAKVVVHNDRDDEVLAQAQEWMEQVGEQPLFLFVNLLGSHLPYESYDAPWMQDQDLAPLSETWAAPWVETMPSGQQGLRLNRKAPGEDHSLVLSVSSGERTLSESQMELLRDTYRSEIWATDRRLGTLLESWATRTGGEGIVVLTSDHGEHFGELGLLDHGHMLNGVNSAVPLVISAPGFPSSRVSQAVSQLEIAPTLRSLVGITKGEGLVDLMQGGERPIEPILARSWPDPKWAQTLGDRFAHGQRLVRLGDWALLALDDGSRSLYRVIDDPLMLHDLSESHENLVSELSRLLGSLDSREQGAAPIPPTEEMLQALRALGYMEP
jgi:arylsulfatase A-like enzyme